MSYFGAAGGAHAHCMSSMRLTCGSHVARVELKIVWLADACSMFWRMRWSGRPAGSRPVCQMLSRCLKFVEFVITSCAIDSSQMHPQMSTQFVCTSTRYNSYTTGPRRSHHAKSVRSVPKFVSSKSSPSWRPTTSCQLQPQIRPPPPRFSGPAHAPTAAVPWAPHP